MMAPNPRSQKSPAARGGRALELIAMPANITPNTVPPSEVQSLRIAWLLKRFPLSPAAAMFIAAHAFETRGDY
jgi:hypothetical protein